jgi:hypothetical protein
VQLCDVAHGRSDTTRLRADFCGVWRTTDDVRAARLTEPRCFPADRALGEPVTARSDPIGRLIRASPR